LFLASSTKNFNNPSIKYDNRRMGKAEDFIRENKTISELLKFQRITHQSY
jgi:hypothetical protein